MTVYLNGKFLPLEQASISVLDRGFIFGDGVYEVIPVYSGRPFRLDAHLLRLQHSLDGIRLANPHTLPQWQSLVMELIRQNEGDDQYLYLHITRGVAKRDHAFPQPPVSPTVYMMSSPLSPPAADILAQGASAITAEDNRWLRCDIKAISLLPNVLLRQLAVDAGCMETILIRQGTDERDSFLTEGAASNIFIVKDGVLLAPPKNNLMLPGITYDVMLELAASHHLPHQVRRISKQELFDADEVLLTSSTREVMPVTLIDGKPVGSGKPGTMFATLHALYQTFKREVMRK